MPGVSARTADGGIRRSRGSLRGTEGPFSGSYGLGRADESAPAAVSRPRVSVGVVAARRTTGLPPVRSPTAMLDPDVHVETGSRTQVRVKQRSDVEVARVRRRGARQRAARARNRERRTRTDRVRDHALSPARGTTRGRSAGSMTEQNASYWGETRPDPWFPASRPVPSRLAKGVTPHGPRNTGRGARRRPAATARVSRPMNASPPSSAVPPVVKRRSRPQGRRPNPRPRPSPRPRPKPKPNGRPSGPQPRSHARRRREPRPNRDRSRARRAARKNRSAPEAQGSTTPRDRASPGDGRPRVDRGTAPTPRPSGSIGVADGGDPAGSSRRHLRTAEAPPSWRTRPRWSLRAGRTHSASTTADVDLDAAPHRLDRPDPA